MNFKTYNNDCLELLHTFEEDSFDVSFTSPPYNRKRNDKYSHFRDINNNWYELNFQVITELLRVTKRHVFYNLQTNYYNRKDVYNLIGCFANKIKDIHVWEKSNPMPASGKAITNAVEYFLVLGKESLKSNTTYTKNILTTSVNSKMPKEHKAVMHPKVADHFISKFCRKGDVVLDPFMGLATTGLACLDHGCKFVGIEKEKVYFDIANNKLKGKIN